MHRLLHPRVHRAVHVRPQEAQVHPPAHEPGRVYRESSVRAKQIGSTAKLTTKHCFGYSDNLTL